MDSVDVLNHYFT